jgi:hypothetical protein
MPGDKNHLTFIDVQRQALQRIVSAGIAFRDIFNTNQVGWIP